MQAAGTDTEDPAEDATGLGGGLVSLKEEDMRDDLMAFMRRSDIASRLHVRPPAVILLLPLEVVSALPPGHIC